MIICSQPECQTTAGCTCTNRLFDYSRLRGEVAAKEAELSALKKQVEELTAERDDARRYAVEARLRENQAEDRRVSESFARTKAEAEAAALRKALEPFANFAEEQVLITENMWLDGAQWGRIGDWFGPTAFADAYRARAALASTRETGE